MKAQKNKEQEFKPLVSQDDASYSRLEIGAALKPGEDVFYNVEKRLYSPLGNTEKHQKFYKNHPDTLVVREYPTGYYCRPKSELHVSVAVVVQQPVKHIEFSFKLPPKAEIENYYERCTLTPEECVKAKMANDDAHMDHVAELTDLFVEVGKAVPRSTIDFPVESKLTVIVDNQYSPYPEDDL